MVKDHQNGCGLYGYSLVSFLFLTGQSMAVLFVCFVVSVYHSKVVEED